MPEKYKQKKGAKPRGVSNRNRGLQWIRANATDGVFYFADDDNTYDIALFDEVLIPDFRIRRANFAWPERHRINIFIIFILYYIIFIF